MSQSALAGRAALRVRAARLGGLWPSRRFARCWRPTPAAAQRTGALVVAYSSPTLKRIDETRVVRLGHRANSPPFAFLDAKKKPIGYSLDLCEIVVDEIAREVGKELTVEFRPVTPENRLELVRSGEIDLECGSTTNTAERRKIVAFSPTDVRHRHQAPGAPRQRHPHRCAISTGKTIVLTRGTVHETAIPKLAERQKLSIKFVFAADHNESFQTLAVGQGRRLRQRRRAALRHAGGNPFGAAISASSAIS